MNQIIEKALTVKSLVVISHRFTWEGLVKLQYTKETDVFSSFNVKAYGGVDQKGFFHILYVIFNCFIRDAASFRYVS